MCQIVKKNGSATCFKLCIIGLVILINLFVFKTSARAEELDYLSFSAVDGDVCIGMIKDGSPDDYALEFSKDKNSWQKVELTDTNENIVEIKEGETYYFKTDKVRTHISNSNYSNNWRFKMQGTGDIVAAGNIMSLLDPSCEKKSVGACAFCYLFANCDKLLQAPKLPATDLRNVCYEGMFMGCKKLKVAPELPATVMPQQCYGHMFNNCTSLEVAPKLPAKKVSFLSYYYMFSDCTSLKEAPELPATTLTQFCYMGMFNNCSSLETLVVGFTAESISAVENPNNYFAGWLNGTAEKGILYCSDTLKGVSNELLGMPAGWTKSCDNMGLEESLAAYAAVFNTQYYYENNNDIAATFGYNEEALLKHFVDWGMKEGRVASAEFNPKYYRSVYADLDVAFGDNWEKYYEHYINCGKSEGRKGAETWRPIVNGVDYSMVFDVKHYYDNNGDVAVVFGYNPAVLFQHFVEWGMKEGRVASAEFNPKYYRSAYADLDVAFGDNWEKYYEHYMNCGKSEGRKGAETWRPIVNGVDYSMVFDVKYYYDNNEDVAVVFGYNPAALFQHFVDWGMKEGRVASAEFNPKHYRSVYADLDGTFGDNWEKYYEHYINCGKSEGRKGAE